jgi:hypothetical protein
MIAATVLAIFFVPVFYVVMQWLSELRGNAAVRLENARRDQSNGHGTYPLPKSRPAASVTG